MSGGWRIAYRSLRVVTAAALVVDAFVHQDLAGRYRLNQGSGPLSQGDLFRIEAVLSVLLALALLISGRWFVWALAWLVAASAVGAVVLYRYHDPASSVRCRTCTNPCGSGRRRCPRLPRRPPWSPPPSDCW